MRLLLCFLLTFTVFIVGTSAQNEFQCPQGTGYFPDLLQCDLYYECSRGQHETKLCPDGLVFDDSDPNHERCDIPANIECGDRTTLQTPKSSKGCPRANGYYKHPDPHMCDKFHNCVDGTPHELPCPPGLIYDDIASTCAWPESSHRKCTDTTRDILDDGFVCPEGETMGPGGRRLPHPTFAHPDDCQKFYICRNGVQPQKGSCSDERVYNEETFQCDEPENVPGCEDYYKKKENQN